MGLFLCMDELIDKLNRLKTAVKPNKLFVEVMRKTELKELIIKLNTGGPGVSLPTSQLWMGIDAKGRRLETIGGGHPVTGTYSPATIEGITGVFKGKREKGLPFDRITLYNNGEYYDSWKISTEVRGENVDILIESNPTIHGNNLFDEWGEDIEGLTDENQDIFARAFLVEALKYLNGI